MWTTEQKDAIDARKSSLLVAAAAGSGKTAVLVERILSLCREGASIDRMLIVTFTNAAAAEMRARILKAFSQAADEGNLALAKQVALVERADICTLHKFCMTVLRAHFQAADVDPAFRLGDESAVRPLWEGALADALDACYESGEGDFLALSSRMNDEEIVQTVESLYAFLLSRSDPWEWLDLAIADCAPDAQALAQSSATGVLMEEARAHLAQCERYLGTEKLCAAGFPAYEAVAEQDASLLHGLKDAAGIGYEALRQAFLGVSFARLPAGKAAKQMDGEASADFREARDAFKAVIQKKLSKLLESSLLEAAADICAMQPALRGLRTLLKTFHTLFQAAKAERNLLDFNDLEHRALRALADDAVADALRAHYDAIFVDEYQDSSAIQEALLARIAQADNLFFVGDVKQSIYRFRQADPTLFLEKYARFSDRPEAVERRIDLNRNFRSRKNILEAINLVFSYCMRSDVTEIAYDDSARLYAGLKHPDEDAPVELHLLADGEEDAEDEEEDADEAAEDAALEGVEQEASLACARIKSLLGTPLWDEKQNAYRPVTYRDIAILMRSTQRSAPKVARLLLSQGIPAFCDAGEGYFDMPEVRMMLDILRVIDNAAQDEPLLAVLHGPALRLTDEELAAIRIAAPEGSYAQAARAYASREDELAKRLSAFYEHLAQWRLLARHQPLSRLILGLMDETGLYARAGALPGGAGRQANLRLLVLRAEEYEVSQGGGLYGFLRLAERLHRSEDSRTAKTLGEGEDVVRILSMHKSKGLEYPIVIALGLGKRFNTRSLNERLLLHPQLGLGVKCIDPEMRVVRATLPQAAIRLKLLRESLAEETRILYVAMTRARDRLILIGRVKGFDKRLRRWAQPMDSLSVRTITTPLDMLMPPLVHAGVGQSSASQAVTAGVSRWLFTVHHALPTLETAHDSAAELRMRLLDIEQAPVPCADIAQALLWRPQLQAADALPAKTSVSAIVRGKSTEAGLPEIMRRPQYMEQRALSGPQRGTVFHAALRAMDLRRLRESTDGYLPEILRTLDRLTAQGALTAEERAAVNASDINLFFASTIGQRLLASARAEREWPFNWRMTDDMGRTALVQGVVDCCFIEAGAWVLLDYKTDSAQDVAAVIARYRPQIELYARALHEITGIPVRERALYLTQKRRAYVC